MARLDDPSQRTAMYTAKGPFATSGRACRTKVALAARRRTSVSRKRTLRLCACLLTLITTMALLVPFSFAFQDTGSEAPRPPTPKDYGKWERLGRATISPNGQWLAFPIDRSNDENELRVRRMDGDELIVAPYASNPAFSRNGRWLAYAIGVSEDEKKELEKSKKTVRNKLGLRDLVNGDSSVVDEVESFAFGDNGAYLAMKRYAPKERNSKGADLVVRNLATGVDLNFGNVSEFGWQEKGTLLAMLVDADGQAGNGVQLYNPTTGNMEMLHSEPARYVGLTWRKDHDDLAALQIKKDDAYQDSTHVILAWRGLAKKRRRAHEFDPTGTGSFPSNTRIVNKRELEWAEDGRSIFFGIKEWQRKPAEADSAAETASNGKNDGLVKTEEPPDLEIWHSRDVRIVPEQKLRAKRKRERDFLAVWHLDDNGFVRLGDELTEDIELVRGQDIAVGTDNTPYEFEGLFGRRYEDVYVIDTANCEKTKALTEVDYQFGASPSGRYLLYLTEDHFWTYDVRTAERKNITSGLPTSFVNHDYDHPVEQKPPFGIAGWSKDDKSVLLYDQYDLWEIPTDGRTASKLTDGAAERIRHRYVQLDSEERFIDMSKPMYVSTYGEWSKKYGFSRVNRRKVESLVWLDKNVGRLVKAKDAEKFAYVVQGFDDSPDYFVSSMDFSQARQVTETNPFQKDYAWGRSELIEFENPSGRPLQGALFYPANYQPGKKYPMIVYIYEIRSNRVHTYYVPSERSVYNVAAFTSNGYFVLQPDIVFTNRAPGPSSVATIERAVAKVIELDLVDAQRIGLVGHSWGGYQTAFAVTQTDIFAAAVAGAPLTNLFSMYGMVFWNTGIPETGHFEVGQERMAVPFWKDPDSYIKSSPVFGVENLNTPLLVEFGDQDGSVDWHQGIEYYNIARRAGKHLVMLVYPGENHGLRKKQNQVDYHRRIQQWFGHFLKDEPAEAWITEGVPYLEQQRILKNWNKNASK